MTSRWVVLTLTLALLATQALAGGPMIIYDAATKTPYAYSVPVPVVTDLGTLGAMANANADGLVAGSAAQWSGVATSSFSASVTSDFAGVGLPDITGANAGLVISVDNPGDGIFVIYDTDGTVTQNYLGAPPGVLGIASPEYAVGSTLTESWVVLNGSTIDPGDLPGATSWQGVITHEMGHSINLAHTQANGAIIFFADGTGPGGCTPPYGGSPSLAHTETMYPFIDISPGSTGVHQATVEHLDDTATLSDIYPAAGYPGNFGTIEGTVFATDGVSPITGVNVIARNVANPYADAQSALSGDFTQGALGADGSFRLTGLTPGADYVLYVDEIVQGGFSTTPLQPLGASEEFWNAAESNNNAADPPCDYTALNVASGQTITTDIQLNSTAAPAPVIGVSPDEFSFSIPTDSIDLGTMTIQNLGPVGASALSWSIVEATNAFDLPVNRAWALDPARVRVENADRTIPRDSSDPIFLRTCTDCAGKHAVRVTPLDFSSTAAAPGMINDGSFELGPGGGAWAEASSNFGTPLCDVAACGTGGGTGPRAGTYWCWFGGIAGLEIGSVSQSVVLPASSSLTLDFYTELPSCDSAADFMEVLVDGVQVYYIDGVDANCDLVGYNLVSLDITTFADGGTHTIEFRSEVFGANLGVTNFFLDDISLVEGIADCPWLSVSPDSGSTPQGGSTLVDVTVDATGLAPGLYGCELRIASNDPATPVVTVPVDLEVLNPGIHAIVFDMNALNGPVSIFSLPNGAGDPLTAAQLWDGVPSNPPIIVDATIGVRLVDGSGAPIVGFPPGLITVQAQSDGWVQCPDFPLIADGPTDASGMTTISGALFAGGHSSPGELMQVIVNDPALASTSYPGGLAGLQYFVNSADIAGDHITNLIDVSDFTIYYYGAGADYAADFVWDGLINLNDISKLALGFGARCPVLPGAVVVQGDPSAAQPSEVIGVTFDTAGTSSARMLEPGDRIDAFVVLQGPAAERGVEAFDARIRVSDNVTVHLQDLVGEGFKRPRGPCNSCGCGFR